MAQWINLHQNNNFINQTSLPFLCEKSGAILLVQVGLRPALRQSKMITLLRFTWCLMKEQYLLHGTINNIAILAFFSGKV